MRTSANQPRRPAWDDTPAPAGEDLPAGGPSRFDGPGGLSRQREPTARSQRLRSLAMAVALIAACTVGAVYAVQSASDTTSVVTLSQDVAEGETIERADLTSTEVAGVQGAIAVDDVGLVEGKIASVDLLAGQVITEDAVTSDPVPGPGERTVGLALTDPQMPDGLNVGDRVQVIAIPEPSSGSKVSKPTVLVDSAQVYLMGATSTSDVGTAQAVTLVVPEDAAADVAAVAANARAALIEAPANGA